jgi:hypothetical protein
MYIKTQFSKGVNRFINCFSSKGASCRWAASGGDAEWRKASCIPSEDTKGSCLRVGGYHLVPLGTFLMMLLTMTMMILIVLYIFYFSHSLMMTFICVNGIIIIQIT